MSNDARPASQDAHRRLEEAYRSEKPRFLARLRTAGQTLEEAEDLVHDVYAETLERLPLIAEIRNLPAWLYYIFFAAVEIPCTILIVWFAIRWRPYP